MVIAIQWCIIEKEEVNMISVTRKRALLLALAVAAMLVVLLPGIAQAQEADQAPDSDVVAVVQEPQVAEGQLADAVATPSDTDAATSAQTDVSGDAAIEAGGAAADGETADAVVGAVESDGTAADGIAAPDPADTSELIQDEGAGDGQQTVNNQDAAEGDAPLDGECQAPASDELDSAPETGEEVQPADPVQGSDDFPAGSVSANAATDNAGADAASAADSHVAVPEEASSATASSGASFATSANVDLKQQTDYYTYAIYAANGILYGTDNNGSQRNSFNPDTSYDIYDVLGYVQYLFIAANVKSYTGEAMVSGFGSTTYTLRSYFSNLKYVEFLVSSSTGYSAVTSLGNSAFYNLPKLAAVYSLGKTKITKVGSSTFSDCEQLVTIVLPKTCTTIESYAFYNCSQLSNVTLTSGLKTIGGGAFRNCTSLHDIDIPSSVTSVGGFAFAGCSDLANVIMRSATPPSGGYAMFDGTYISRMTSYTTEGGIFVPSETAYDRYRSAYGWSDYKQAVHLLRLPSITEAECELTQTVFNWKGTAIEPVNKVKVIFNGRLLVRGTDYWLSYKDNVKQGIASVLIHGKKNFTGVKTLKFRIGGKTVDLPNGYFEICKSLKANTHISVNSANANVNARNYAANQRFQIVKCENGAYRIVNVGTGKALGVTSAGNVTESAWANKWAQQWIPEKVTNTSWIQWRNHKNGKFLCMPNTYSPGTNVATATSNGKGSQQWLLRKAVPYVSDGNDRRIALAAVPTKVVSPSNNNTSAGANANLSTKVNKDNDYYTWMCQDMVFHRNANGFYVIEDYLSGCVLQANSEGNVLFGTKQGSTGALAQQWALMQYKTSAGEVQYYIINAKYAKALGTRDKSTAYHANAMIFPRSKALRWVFVR